MYIIKVINVVAERSDAGKIHYIGENSEDIIVTSL